MRERLVAAFAGVTVLVVALFGVPRAYLLGDLVRADEQARVDRTADVLADLLVERVADGRAVTPAYLDSLAAPGERLAVSGLPSGEVQTTGGADEPDGAVQATRRLGGGGTAGTVTVTRTGTAVRDEITRALLPLALLGVLLAALAALVTFLLAGRLARPFRQLAGFARGLGEGDLHPDVPRYDVPEADAIGLAVVEAGRRLDHLLTHERQVAVRASHELRTPVTALRLELEDLAMWPGTAPEVTAALARGVAELDRLSTAITGLLELSDAHRAAAEIDLELDTVLADVAARRRADGLPVVHVPGTGAARTRLDPTPVRQSLDQLVEQALAEGAPEVRLCVLPHAGHLEVRVEGSPAAGGGTDASPRMTLAGELAVAAGGQLARDGTTLLLRLPRRGEPPRTTDSAQ